MEKTTQVLYTFIDSAERSRKYPSNTAGGLRAALKLFEPEIRDEEQQSVEEFKKNLEPIYQAVYNKNKTKFTAGSLFTYRKRVSKLLSDYFAYGVDATKMANWKPKTIVRKSRTPGTIERPGATQMERESAFPNPIPEFSTETHYNRHEFPFKALIATPNSLTYEQWEEINKYVKFLEPKKITPTNAVVNNKQIEDGGVSERE